MLSILKRTGAEVLFTQKGHIAINPRKITSTCGEKTTLQTEILTDKTGNSPTQLLNDLNDSPHHTHEVSLFSHMILELQIVDKPGGAKYCHTHLIHPIMDQRI